MANTCAIILGGGKGTRMKTEQPKVMCEMLFKPMVDWVIDAVRGAGIADICVVTGHEREIVEAHLTDDIVTAFQSERLGTGHAVMQCTEFLEAHRGYDVVVLNGDGSMMDTATIEAAYSYHKENKNSITLVTAIVEDTNGIGHIKRDENGKLERIIEHKDANDWEKVNLKESNAGTYWFNVDDLLVALTKITNENSQNEYYLTDTLSILIAEGKNAGAYVCEDPTAVLGANDRVQLNDITKRMVNIILKKHMVNGVDIPLADGIMIGPDVVIGNDTRILPGTILLGKTEIGRGCSIGPNCYIVDSKIGDGAALNTVQCYESEVDSNASIGPFVHIRPGSKVHAGAHLGNFVEVKNSEIGEGSKVSHLTYVGDADVGENVNFGCGCVTVNYDGKKKHRTTVKDNAFIGCNTNLVAPVTVGKNAYVAAGSTITEDVPSDALGIARAKQKIKEDWVKEKKPYKNMK